MRIVRGGQADGRLARDGVYYHAHMAKSRITVTIDQALLDRARSLGVNLSAACERGIAEVTETVGARVELARQVADYEDNGGVYDDEKLARARRILADAQATMAVKRRAG